MAYLFLALAIAVVALIVAYLHNIYTYWERRGVPSLPAVPFLGNLKGVGKKRHIRDLQLELYKRFKGTAPFAGLYLLISKSALILDLDLIKAILIKDFNNFRNRGIFHNTRDDPLSGHLFSLDADEWRAMRLKLTPVFTSGKMRHMFPTITDVAENLVSACESIAKEDTDGALEVKELCARFTTDVIGTCAFGIECNSLKDPKAEFRNRGRDIFDKPRHSPMVQTLFIANPKLATMLHMKFFSDETIEFFLGVVKDTVNYRLKHGVKRNDFMDMLIEMKAKNEQLAKQSAGIDLSHGLTLEQMAAQAFVFFVAGFDTSSTTMAFCLYELAVNIKIQDQLREEIQTVLQAHKGELTYEAMKEMQYLDQVVAETLRKYPVVPHLVRKPAANYRVANTKHVIEADTTCLIPVYALHTDPEYYPEPEKFDPARFNPEVVEQRNPMTYLPFGDGPRNCIGLRFGRMQAKIGLIVLLTNFKFTTAKRTEVPLQLSNKFFLTNSKSGIYLHVNRIEKAA